MQALLEQAVYKPVQGRFKVFMVDEVHMLTNTAFNAMLKTLEEPPDYLKFVLATTDPQKVPVTVLSRCLQFNLRPMAPETIREHLIQVLGQEAVASDPQALRLLARAARGSMRDALSLTDQAIAFGAGALSEATVRTMLGSVDRSYVFRLIEALALGDGRTVVQTVDSLRLNGLSAASTLEEMATVLQRMAVLQTMGPAPTDGDDDSDTEAQDTARLAALLPVDETQLLYSICLHGRGDLGLAPDEYAALTMVLLRLLAFKPPVPQGERVPTASNAPLVEKKTLNSAPAPVAAPLQRPTPAESAPVAQAPVAAQPTVQPWEDHPAASDLPVPSETLPHSASTQRTAVPAQSPGSAAKPVTAAVYSQNGAVPPGHILPVRASPGGDLAPEEIDARDEGALAVSRRPAPIDHRVVGVPVRQQTESRCPGHWRHGARVGIAGAARGPRRRPVAAAGGARVAQPGR